MPTPSHTVSIPPPSNIITTSALTIPIHTLPPPSTLSTLIIVILNGTKHNPTIPSTTPTPISLITTLTAFLLTTLTFSKNPLLTRNTMYTTNATFVSDTRKA
ncbi:hypothetical protein K440DRAFT_621036 [Wilcoxina mikolae CBS 423.85]|nr:hypothetical protein K440DRAFT_621036 [Wilcoxina mikolae CBS 423.85]